MATIDFGVKQKNDPELTEAMDGDEGKEDKVHYPTLYVGGLKTKPKIPLTGTATITYEVISEENRHKAPDGPCFSCELRVLDFSPKAQKEKAPSAEDAEKDIDKALKEAESETPTEKEE